MTPHLPRGEAAPSQAAERTMRTRRSGRRTINSDVAPHFIEADHLHGVPPRTLCQYQAQGRLHGRGLAHRRVALASVPKNTLHRTARRLLSERQRRRQHARR